MVTLLLIHLYEMTMNCLSNDTSIFTLLLYCSVTVLYSTAVINMGVGRTHATLTMQFTTI